MHADDSLVRNIQLFPSVLSVLDPVKQLLDESFSYDEIRLARLLIN